MGFQTLHFANQLGNIEAALWSRDPLAEANRWAANARPLIDAYLTIERLHGKAYESDGYVAEAVREIYAEAQGDLHRSIEAMRDEAVTLAAPVGPYTTDDELDRADELEREVTTVAAAIRAVRNTQEEAR